MSALRYLLSTNFTYHSYTMHYIEQIYTKCLAEASYYIESNGFAAIIDPLRDVEPYLELARRRGSKVIYVFETHFHADFVSGHVDLSDKTEAIVVYGPTTLKTGYPSVIAEDGQVFQLGEIKIQLIHTPGHTMESSCYLLKDETGKATALFTGDTLFIGDVGRPDLAQKLMSELTPEKLAGHLYDSLRNKLFSLPDELVIYPGHGAGSACGKHMSKETMDTLGHQKRTNYALNPALSKDEFIQQVLQGLTPPPAYFPQDVILNIRGYTSYDQLLKHSLKALSADEFAALRWGKKLVVLDTRRAQVFAKAFIPGSLNIGLDGDFASWAGTLLKTVTTPILVVAEPGQEKEAITRLARVGFDQVLGYLQGGFETWQQNGKGVDSIASLTADEVAELLQKKNTLVLDVRRATEYEQGHVIDAINIPLDYLEENKQNIPRNKTVYVYCAAGYRSMAFVSFLRAQGYINLIDVHGGFKAIKSSASFAGILTGAEATSPAQKFCDITKVKRHEKI